MDAEKLVKMANQIATFFAIEPVRADAIAGITGHLVRFWEPRMRREILAAFDASGNHGMHELVAEVMRTQRAVLEPAVKRG